MSIFQFNPGTFFPQQESPGDIGNSAINAFYAAQQNSRANQGMKNENERLGMQKQTFAAGMEENAYEKTLRPLKEQSMRLGVAQQGLQIEGQALNLRQSGNALKLQEMQMNVHRQNYDELDQIDQWMVGAAKPEPGPTNDLTTRLPANLQPLASTFEEAGRKYGLNPAFLAAVSAHETAGGTSNAFRNKNNAMGISNAVGPIAFADAKESIFQQARSLAGKTYRGADDVEAIGAIYAPPGAGNDPGNLNPSWSSGVRHFLKQFAGSETVPVRTSEALSGGTGVPSLTHAVAAVAPTGAPLVAVAAGSLNPSAVIAQAFTPLEQQAMAVYDKLSALAQTGLPDQKAGAVVRMQAMQRDPRFIAAAAKKVEMEKAVTNQIQVNGMLQTVQQPYLDGFNATYGDRFTIEKQPDGQFLPRNTTTGQPLNSQEQVAFAGSFQRHMASYDPAKIAEARSAAINKVTPLIGTIIAAQSIQPPAPPPEPPRDKDGKIDTESAEYKIYAQQLKPYELAVAKYRDTVSKAAGAKGEFALLANTNEYAQELFTRMFPAPVDQMGPPAPETAAAAAPEPDDASLTISEKKERKQNADKATADLERVANVAPAAESLVAKLSAKEGVPISLDNLANEILKGKGIPTGRTLKQNFTAGVGTMPIEVPENISAAAHYAEMMGVDVKDAVTWAKAYIAKRSSTAAPVAVDVETEALAMKYQ